MWDFRKYGNNIALVGESGVEITYKELYQMQAEVALFMKYKHSLVFLICNVSIKSIIIYIACVENKIPIMLIDDKLSEERIERLISEYQPAYVWCSGEKLSGVDYVVEQEWKGYYLYHNQTSIIFCHENLSLLLLTSGTTGSKKSVRISYQNMKENMVSIAESLILNERDVAMLMLPMCYAYGLSVINSNLYAGATLLVPCSGLCSTKFWDFFNKYKGTSLCGVPYTYELLKKLNFHKKALPSLRLITQAGGALGIEEQKYLLEYGKKHHVNIGIMYGQTEATARISCYFLNLHEEKIGSVGKVIPKGMLKINGTGTEREGEIIYTGKNVCMGYAHSFQDLSKPDENNGILHTGDIGYMDEEGYLFITGRKKRFAKILGIRINLDELQSSLSLKLKIFIVCIEYDGVIWIIVPQNKSIFEGEIKKEIDEMGIDKRVIRVVFMKKLPRESNGKISYFKIQNKIKGEVNGNTDKVNQSHL